MRVFIVDDHPIVLSGLAALISSQEDMTLAGLATSAENALREIVDGLPDIAVIDISLPGINGLSLIERLVEQHPGLKLVALTAYEEPGFLRKALAAGASAFVVKRTSSKDLLHAIRLVHAGENYFDPALAKALQRSPQTQGDPGILSQRELSVIRLVARGYSNKEISTQLNLSVKTIETYRTRAAEKLQLRSRAAIVRFAQANGWLTESTGWRDEEAGPIPKQH
jgi:DNA-binding NarL/FixJ family response regulator